MRLLAVCEQVNALTARTPSRQLISIRYLDALDHDQRWEETPQTANKGCFWTIFRGGMRCDAVHAAHRSGLVLTKSNKRTWFVYLDGALVEEWLLRIVENDGIPNTYRGPHASTHPCSGSWALSRLTGGFPTDACLHSWT